jgi:hypothetical protein
VYVAKEQGNVAMEQGNVAKEQENLATMQGNEAKEQGNEAMMLSITPTQFFFIQNSITPYQRSHPNSDTNPTDDGRIKNQTHRIIHVL